MSTIKVNGAAVPSPSELKVTVFDVSSGEARSASGGLVMDRIAVKRRLSLRWAHLTPAELGALLGQVGGGFFEAEYPDPRLMAQRTMVCRCGEAAAGVLRVDGGAPVWVDVRMEWTER